MTAGERLLREIHEHPDEDAPRIVYADWLEQHGDEEARARADLIHAQIELEHAAPADRPALHARINAVLKQYRRRWLAELTRARLRGGWRFRRGFIDGGTMSATRFVEVAPQIFELAPLVRSMIFPEASNELVALVESPYFDRLVDVGLEEMCRCGRCPIERELPALFTAPTTTHLRRLVLTDDRIDSANATLLFESPHLRGLRVLDLAKNRLDAAAMEALAARGGTFDELVLASNPLGDAGAIALAAARELSISRLDLSDTGITEPGARALAEAGWADSIARLELRAGRIGKARVALRARFGDRLVL